MYQMDLIGPELDLNPRPNLPKESRIVTAMNVCKDNSFVLVSTCTEKTLNSPCFHLLRLSLPSSNRDQSSDRKSKRMNPEALLDYGADSLFAQGSTMIKLLDEMPLNNLGKRLGDNKSTYVYDISCEFSVYGDVIFVGYLCHFKRAIYVLSVMAESKLVLVDLKHGNYSNIRVLKGNSIDSVAGVGSNGMVSILRCASLENGDVE